MVEGMIYLLRVGCPWRDLPTVFGNWSSVYTRWRRWAHAGVWSAILRVLARSAKGQLRAIDATFIKVHQHGSNPVGGQAPQGIGRTKGGLNTKLHAIVDGEGHAVALLLTEGQVHDIKAAPELLQSMRHVIVVADKAYDSNALRELLLRQGCRACISNKVNRKEPAPFHRGWYRKRHRIENFFQRAKSKRRFATRFDKTLTCFLSTVALTAVLDWLN